MNSYIKKTVYIGLTILCIFIINEAAYASTRGVVTGDTVNVRAYSEVNDNNRLFQVNRGQEVEILGICGDFFRVNVNGVENVYISQDWVNILETHGSLDYGSVYVYDLPRENGGQPISHIIEDSGVIVVSSVDDWFGIIYNDELAFVEKFHVTVPYFVELPVARIPGLSTFGEEIVEFAMQYLGSPYRFGGTSPSGFDCSGFMVYVLRHFGININRVSRDQVHNGVHVDRASLQVGDLVFFAASPGGSRITHVGMYIGGGEFIHSSTWGIGVRISSMNCSYNSPRFVAARRVI